MLALVRVSLVSLLAIAVHASAENRVCIGGDLDHLSASETSGCWNTAHEVSSDAAKFHLPADWHFYVICTDSDWKAYAAFSRRSATELATLNADTDLRQRVTFLRGSRLPAEDVASLDRVVAHEVASAQLGSTDETLIARQVAVLRQESEQATPVLQASR